MLFSEKGQRKCKESVQCNSDWNIRLTSLQLPSIVGVVYREFVSQTRRTRHRIKVENSTQFNQHVRKHMARRCAMCMREVRKGSWDM